jgi:carboxypeptidase C (cathepsin A)
VPPARTVVTHHVATIAGREVRYTATAGTMLLTAADGDPTASVFYVAYTADDLGPHARRPLTFSYNGGPGGTHPRPIRRRTRSSTTRTACST